MYPSLEVDEFTFSRGWFLRFLWHNNIFYRASIYMCQNLLEYFLLVMINWTLFNCWNCPFELCMTDCLRGFTIPGAFEPTLPWESIINCAVLSYMCNIDQTPVPFLFLNGHIYDIMGINCVQMKTRKSGWKKRQDTLMLTIFANGILCVTPLLIFKAVNDVKLKRLQTEKRL